MGTILFDYIKLWVAIYATSWVYVKRSQSQHNQKDIITPIFMVKLFITVRKSDKLLFIHQLMSKEDAVHKYGGILFD